MSIQVRFFASMRERMGRDREDVNAAAVKTAGDVWTTVARGEPLPPNVLIAVNMEYVAADHTVVDGDEVAFFPPVTGG